MANENLGEKLFIFKSSRYLLNQLMLFIFVKLFIYGICGSNLQKELTISSLKYPKWGIINSEHPLFLLAAIHASE